VPPTRTRTRSLSLRLTVALPVAGSESGDSESAGESVARPPPCQGPVGPPAAVGSSFSTTSTSYCAWCHWRASGGGTSHSVRSTVRT